MKWSPDWWHSWTHPMNLPRGQIQLLSISQTKHLGNLQHWFTVIAIIPFAHLPPSRGLSCHYACANPALPVIPLLWFMKPPVAHLDFWPTIWQQTLTSKRICKRRLTLTKPSLERLPEFFLKFLLLLSFVFSLPNNGKYLNTKYCSRSDQTMMTWCSWSSWTWWWPID